MIDQKKLQLFHQIFSNNPQCISFAPGRVNLIGEHTDYTGGMVFPFAIKDGITLFASPRVDKMIHIYDSGFQIDVQCQLNDTNIPDVKMKNFIEAVRYCARFSNENFNKSFLGANILIDNTLPIGGGVSSSAAMFVAISRLVFFMTGAEQSDSFYYHFAQKLEHEIAHVPCGIMDQMASVLGKEKHLVLISCDNKEYQWVKWSFDNAEFILFDSGVRHELQNSAYPMLAQKAKEILIFLQDYHYSQTNKTFSWKDFSHHFIQSANSLDSITKYLKAKISEVEYAEYEGIAKHIIFENIRVFQTVLALTNENLLQVGRIVSSSHRSLKNDYQVSHKVCDFIVDNLLGMDGVYGSRIVGAGFGGNVLVIVSKECRDNIIIQMQNSFKNTYHRDLLARIVFPSDGAKCVRV